MLSSVRVCFVCSGNICRSPTAETVMLEMARARDLADLIEVDSAGTGAWHVGQGMDDRSRDTLRDAGYRPGPHSAKQFDAEMFGVLDLVVALDSGHRDALWALAANTPDAPAARAKIVMLRDWDDARTDGEGLDVADPYYGGEDGFTDVLAQIERSCARLLSTLEARARPAAQQADNPPL